MLGRGSDTGTKSDCLEEKTSRQFALKNWILFYIVVLGLIFVEILELVLKPNAQRVESPVLIWTKTASTIMYVMPYISSCTKLGYCSHLPLKNADCVHIL